MESGISKLKENYKILHPQVKLFVISCTLSSSLSLYFLAHLQPEALIGVMVGLVTMFLLYLYLSRFYSKDQKKWMYYEPIMFLLLFVMVFHLPSYYLAASRIAFHKQLTDNTLIKLDEFLLGWVFPKGQLAIYLDKNDLIGPHTSIGKFVNNFLQMTYFTYYLIPYLTMYVILLSSVIKEFIYRKTNSGLKSSTYYKNWADIFFIFSVYSLTCFIVFFINTLVPAGSPRLHLKEHFRHELKLYGFAKWINGHCKDDRSANSFPSGHVSETFCISLALFAMNRKSEGRWSLAGTILIACATLALRYHYFVDLIAAFSISTISYLINYKFGYVYYLKYGYDTNGNGEKDFVEEIKKENVENSKEIENKNNNNKENKIDNNNKENNSKNDEIVDSSEKDLNDFKHKKLPSNDEQLNSSDHIIKKSTEGLVEVINHKN